MHDSILHFVLVLTVVFLGFSSVLLLLKAKRYKSLGAVAAALPRLYTLFVATIFLITHDIPVLYIHLGVLGIVAGDCFLHLAKIYEKRYDKAIELNKQLAGLAALQTKFSTMMENAQVGTYIMNTSGKFEYINPVFCEITEYSRAELLEKTLYDITPSDIHSKIKTLIKVKTNGGKALTDSYVCLLRKNSGPVTVRDISFKTENGHPTITGSISVSEETYYGNW